MTHEHSDSLIAPPKRFTSTYAPLTPDGPLPPGVSEDTVTAAYRSVQLRPKLALITMGIKTFIGSPTSRLRQAVDRPDARRERRGDRHRPSFHEALYGSLRAQSHDTESVYARFVEPAERTEGERTFLDVPRFRELVHTHWREGPEVRSLGDEGETLALFAFAFALLQPQDAYAILEPLLECGPAFQEFFGARRTA
jgi:hypothetical protein